MTRRELLLSALAIFAIALVVRAWAATQLTFPRPEDTAYYVDVARNLLAGHGLTSDAIWSYGTPPLAFPRPAFEIWLPLPTFIALIPMAVLGSTFAAAQIGSVVIGSVVAVLAWRLAADVAQERGMSTGRTRALALGAGLGAAVYLPLVLASVEPDSTMPFAALVLGASLVMARLLRGQAEGDETRLLIALGVLLGLAALTRNETAWLALIWAVLAWRRLGGDTIDRLRGALRVIGIPAAVAIAIFAPWAIRDWLAFGSPLPGQAISNALFLDGRDVFAWDDPPTLGRYLDAGLGTLIELRIGGFLHNLVSVLLLLGVPASAVGLLGLRWTAGAPALRPLLLFSLLTFLVTVLVFPVATTWGTFLHAAGAIHVLVLVSALLVLDALIERVRAARGWTRPVAWLGPAMALSGSLLLTAVLLPTDGRLGRDTQARFEGLPQALAAAGVPLPDDGSPVITDFPIWFAYATGHRAIALPNESPASVLDLAQQFGARLLIVDADNDGIWPEVLADPSGVPTPDAECFHPIVLAAGDPEGPLGDVVAFRVGCD